VDNDKIKLTIQKLFVDFKNLNNVAYSNHCLW